jgi:alpha-L-arabinofuranosidase
MRGSRSTNPLVSRREAMQTIALGAGAAALARAGAVVAGATGGATLQIDPTPRYELSPYLYMQFMEPLGVTDSSVEAAWDHLDHQWRDDVIDATRDLEPTMVRWGGIFTDYYRWREGVGPRDRRPTMVNLMWGGLESNQIGTAEFVDFCQQVHADPLVCVNFEGDGREQYQYAGDSLRWGDVQEAADWVAYCNDPDNQERRGHGFDEPLRVPFWQLGNETSYDDRGFDRPTAIDKTIEFAKAMRAVDPTIKIIGWGDSGWAGDMYDRAGEHLDMLAFHHMFNPDNDRDPVLRGEFYRRDPGATWQVLMDAWKHNDAKIREARDSLDGREIPLAMTECHFAIPGRNRCDVLSTWAAGVSYARILNNHQRHGDALKIATAADFCGTRWQVNALMIPVPRGDAYLMPVARVMQLYRHHIGKHAVDVESTPEGLDVVASRTDDTLFLHVVNTHRDRSAAANLKLPGGVERARAFQIVDDPMIEVSDLNSRDVMQIAERDLASSGDWEFPAASVTAVEVQLAA